MQEKMNHDAIMLGFGHGYLGISDCIISEIKHMREEIKSNTGMDFPKIHIVDHDYDTERNIVWLNQNEFVIRVFGEEKIRCHSDDIKSDIIINQLKKVILENILQFNHV